MKTLDYTDMMVLHVFMVLVDPHQTGLERTLKVFKKEFGLHITSTTNKKVVSFLDITFNFDTGISKPCKKPNDHPVYINVNLNHPPNPKAYLQESIKSLLSRKYLTTQHHIIMTHYQHVVSKKNSIINRK